MNAARLNRSDRLARVAVPTVLAGIGVLHGVWATGNPWPATDRESLAEAAIGGGGGMPPDAASAVVGVGLVGAAVAVLALGPGSARPHRIAVTTLAGVLAARGATFEVHDAVKGYRDRFSRLDAVAYSPLCLALAAGIAVRLRATRAA